MSTEIHCSTRLHSDFFPPILNSETALGTSNSPSFEMARKQTVADLLKSALDATLNDENELMATKVATVANDKLHVE